MKFFYLLACFLFLAGHSLAQPVVESSGPEDGSTQREQRRVDLRQALKAQRQAAETREEKRQLTPQEREELRQQLRRQPQAPVGSKP